MAKTVQQASPPASPDVRFRGQIEAALQGGAAHEALILRLTHRDVSLMSRDPVTPVADISYAGGVMRFLGVRVEKGGVLTSALERVEA